MPRHVALVVAVAIAALSTASVLSVRAFALGVDPLAIGFWRTAMVAAVLLPAVYVGRGRTDHASPLAARDLARIALGGVFLAMHFACWIQSLALTSVLRSTVLVTLAPAWAALFEAVVWSAPPPRRFWAGMAVSLAGVVLLSGALSPQVALDAPPASTLTGDALALAGGGFGAGYWLAGRAARARVDIGKYAALVSAAAALVLLPLALGTGTALVAHGGEAWVVLALVALGPQLVGHNGINYAMRHVSASHASGLVLLEPVGASLLAAAALAQFPATHELAGGALVVVGVFVAKIVTTPVTPRLVGRQT